MSNPDHPDRKDEGPSVGSHFPGAGRSARAGDIGEELGGDLDFEPDALLDSLLAEPAPPEPPAGAAAPSAAATAAGVPRPLPSGATARRPGVGDRDAGAPAVTPRGIARPLAPPRPDAPGTTSVAPAPPRRRLDAPPPAPRPAPVVPPRPFPSPAAVRAGALPPPGATEPALPPAAARHFPRPAPTGAPEALGAVTAPRPRAPERAAATGAEREPVLPEDDDDTAGLEDGTALLEELEELEELAAAPPAPTTPEPSPAPANAGPLAGEAAPGEPDQHGPAGDEPQPLAAVAPDPAPSPAAPASPEPLPRTEPLPAPVPAPSRPRGADAAPELEEDPVDGLESLPPHAFDAAESPGTAPAHAAGTAWPDERPAASFLAEQDGIAEFSARAAWLEAEAAACADAGARARSLLVASELWAICGEVGRARDAAERAVKAAPGMPLATRQVRWLASLSGDQRFVSTALEIETRASATADARLHAACLNAEIRRIAFGDAEGALQRADLAARLDPADPRPHLLRIASQLGTTVAPSRHALQALTVPDEPSLAAFRAAVVQVARRRGLGPADDGPPVPRVAFEDARRALAREDVIAAAEALSVLASVEGLERGALWLAASLLAHGRDTRARASHLLATLERHERTTPVTRAVLARALELGDTAGVQAALAAEPDDRTFSVADRLVLGVLGGADGAALAPAVAALAQDPALAPLAQAAAMVAGPPTGAPPVPEAVTVRLGRALGGEEVEALTEAHDAYMAEHGESALARVLAVELALLGRDAPALAMHVAAWPAAPDEPNEDRDRQLVAGLILAAAGRRDDARAALEAALAADPTCEMAARALAATDEADDAAARFVSLAEQTSDETAQALLLVEAALRSGRADATYEALLRRAAEIQPDLPFSAHLGELSARRRGDAEAVVDWLRLRRLAATDALERALDATREALLVADGAPEEAARRLEECLATRPEDVGLHALAERISPAPALGRGRWREALAPTLDDAAARALLTTASLEYELCGASEDAWRSAEAAAGRGSPLGRVVAERLAPTTAGAAALELRWTTAAESTTDPAERRRLHARLAELASARGDAEAALTWTRALLADDPHDLGALRRLEHAYLGVDRAAELEPVAAALVGVLDRAESIAHAQTAARLRARLGRWEEGRELAHAAFRHGDPGLWTLRQLSAHARAAGDDEEQLVVDQLLLGRASRAIDAATLALRAGEVAARLERFEEARGLLERAVELLPEHFVALTTYAEILEATRQYEAAATVLQTLAQACQVDRHRAEAWHQAGILWQDRLGNRERACAALEQAAELDPSEEDVFTRLQALYVEGGDRAALATLLERRLARVTDPEERVRLEITRGRALAEIGDRRTAKSAVAAALDANPDHAEALATYADLCLADADWEGAEQAWIRLARHATEPARQAEIYQRLGALYDDQLPNPRRAELAYLEVLKRRPQDLDATRRLVAVYGRLGQPERSVELQTELVNRAEVPEAKRDRTLELARVYEEIVGDGKQAEATLDKARKAWPHDGRVLRAVADFYQRRGENKSLQVLLERSANDARRALNTGRFDPAFFDVLASVAELRGGADAARIANATVAALAGEPSAIDGGGPAAGAPELDDLLAPELISLPLRVLLKRAGTSLDHAFRFDAQAVRAAPLPSEMGGYVNHVQQVAEAFGLGSVEVLATGALGPVCVPARADPPVIVLGQALLDSGDDAGRFFLLLRSLKILQANAGALSRAAPVDLWPMLAAFLHTLCPSWTPSGVDARRLEDHRQRLAAVMPRTTDPDVAALALEVAGALGTRASQLGTAIHQWGNRAALLAVGDLDVALRAIAKTQGHTAGPPPSGIERMKWITRNPEARDLAVFSVSDAYAEARRQLGLT